MNPAFCVRFRSDYIKADGRIFFESVSYPVIITDPADFPLFSNIHGFRSRAMGMPGSVFDLCKHCILSILEDQVNLSLSGTEISGDDPGPTLANEFCRQRLHIGSDRSFIL